MSDSIAKYVTGIDGCVVQAFRGDTISKMTHRINSNAVNLSGFSCVILHVGTNDIGRRAKVKHMLSDYANLIAVYRKSNPTIKIIVSAIIRRPVDHEITETVIKEVNGYIQRSMSKDLDFQFICTYKPFTREGKIKEELIAGHQVFLLFPQCSLSYLLQIQIFE